MTQYDLYEAVKPFVEAFAGAHETTSDCCVVVVYPKWFQLHIYTVDERHRVIVGLRDRAPLFDAYRDYVRAEFPGTELLGVRLHHAIEPIFFPAATIH